jgi:hypothetical protein
MNRIVLIGTSHKYQLPDNADASAFANLIRSSIDSSDAAAIAEEMSLEALAQKGASQSICSEVANERAIRHLYCDPDNETRNRLTIQGENDIRLAGFFNNLSEGEIEKNIHASHDRRELYWLSRILQFNCWPIIFICGANHVDSFSAKIRAGNLSPEVLERDWSP